MNDTSSLAVLPPHHGPIRPSGCRRRDVAILKYDLDGNFLYGWGGPGPWPGQFAGPHQLTTDQDGNLYVAEVFNGRVVKFRPKPNADPAKVVGQELRYTASTN